MNAFKTLNNINVNDHTERKNGLTYLAWAWAWGELKKLYPESYYTVYENKDGLFYHTDGKTCWVKTGVTLVDGDIHLEHIEYLPVMDFKNKSIPVEQVTSFDVNKAIQRSLTKAVARHGLGLYIYAGEDLPEEEAEAEHTTKVQKRMENAKPATVTKSTVYDPRPEIASLKKRFGIDDNGFANMRKALVDGGAVENKPSSEMTEEDWKLLFHAIEVNFGDAA
jgi:hypothetical protein